MIVALRAGVKDQSTENQVPELRGDSAGLMAISSVKEDVDLIDPTKFEALMAGAHRWHSNPVLQLSPFDRFQPRGGADGRER